MNDVRFALRQHFKHSGFFVAAVLMLALGIGATTSLFSAVYGVLIDPYPYAKRSEEHTSELQSRLHLVCRLLLEKKNKTCSACASTGHKQPERKKASCVYPAATVILQS